MSVSLLSGDITKVDVDAIVNAANAYLAAGGGVSGAIHRAAGPELAKECSQWVLEHGPLKPGEAMITKGYALPAAHVIHVLGPRWEGGSHDEAATLARAYRNAIEVADDNGLRTVALPSVSTGIFGYPLEEAAPIAIRSVRDTLAGAKHVQKATFILYDAATYDAFRAALAH